MLWGEMLPAKFGGTRADWSHISNLYEGALSPEAGIRDALKYLDEVESEQLAEVKK